MKKIPRIAASFVAVAGLLSPGIVAATQGTIDTTGPGSTNIVEAVHDVTMETENKNDVKADVDVDQDAHSGSATVSTVTTAEDVTTGDSMNENAISGSVTLTNTAGAGALADLVAMPQSLTGSIKLTGPNSDNQVTETHTMDVSIENSNKVNLDVDVDQDAHTGSANVSNTTTVGNVTTGAASNSSTTTFSINMSN